VGVIIIGLGWNDVNCLLAEWFSFTGITMLLTCAGIKAFRIASIFNGQTFSGKDLTDKTLLKYFFGSTMVMVTLLIIYTILTFIFGNAYYRELNMKTGPLWKEHRCSSKPAINVSYYLLVVYVLLLLIFVLRYGNQTRAASSVFKETQCIYLGTNIGTLVFVAFGIFILFTTDYSAQIAVRGFGTLIVIFVVIVLLFGPKIRAVYAGAGAGINLDGLSEKDRQLNSQYATTLRQRNSKELMLVMKTLLGELKYRLEYKMMTVEISEENMSNLVDLSTELKTLVDNEKITYHLTPLSSTSDLMPVKNEDGD